MEYKHICMLEVPSGAGGAQNVLAEDKVKQGQVYKEAGARVQRRNDEGPEQKEQMAEEIKRRPPI